MSDVIFHPESSFLEALFECLNEESLAYAVLRNYENLPEHTDGSDIDIAVLPEDRGRIAKLIHELASEHNAGVIVDYIGSGQFLRVLGAKGAQWWGVAIDLFDKIEYRGVAYISSSKIIDRSDSHNLIRVANDQDSLMIALIKELIINGKSRKNYLQESRALWHKEGESCIEILKDSFGSNILSEIIDVLSSSHENIDGLVMSLRADVLLRGKYRDKALNIWLRIRRLWNPPGISIAVLGTDGAGKTTVIDALRPVLEQAMHSHLQYNHLRPNWIPSLGVLTGKREKSDGSQVTDPHSQKPSGFLGSLVRLCYYTLDYTLGYWFKVHPKISKEPKIFIFDRYFYDFILDPLRMRISLPSWLLKVVLSVAPQPHLILCLGAKPEILFARKPETSIEDVSRQVCELQRLCRQNSRAIWIDTGVDIDDSCDLALKTIGRTMIHR